MFNRQSIHIALLLWGAIFCLITALCTAMTKNYEKKKWMLLMQLICAVLLFSDACAWMYKGNAGIVSGYIVRSSNFLVFLMTDLLLGVFHGYVGCILFDSENAEKKKQLWLVWMVVAVSIILVIISQFTGLYYVIDEQNVYRRSSCYFLSVLLPIIAMLLDCRLILKNRRKMEIRMMVALLSYIILPLLAAVIQMFWYGLSLVNIAISISMLLLFVEWMIEQRNKIAEQEILIAKQYRELTDSRVATMMSQIRAHFIFNVLGTISGYCKIDPEKADEALAHFSRYLRRNMKFLEEKDMIPFMEEVHQLEDYVALEQMRFSDMIEFGENLQVTDFLIPPLTIQPLVENAIKHGLVECDRAGNVCLFTRREEGAILIEVVDDGAGFSVEDIDEKKSYGIRNVRYRLEQMAGALLEIESKPGCGTTVCIKIPEKRKNVA